MKPEELSIKAHTYPVSPHTHTELTAFRVAELRFQDPKTQIRSALHT